MTEHAGSASGLTVRPFEPGDQEVARLLILEGLREHFGFIDETRNTDLDDIPSYYADGLFLVALSRGELVGTGALVPIGRRTAQVVRMSVDRGRRQAGGHRAGDLGSPAGRGALVRQALGGAGDQRGLG